MRAVSSAIEEYADSNEPVLIVGEHGSGRELVARILHRSSPRANGEFVTVRAALVPKILFGDAADAASEATLRAAEGGTILVKDLSELTRAAQRRLHGVVRTRGRSAKCDYDVRIVGSSERDLDLAVEAGLFQKNLYDALAARRIVVPPLRERVADIAPLAAHLIKEYGREAGRNRMTVSTRAHERLVKYPWPGNAAELKSVARRLVFRAKKSRVEAGDVDAVLPTVAERVPLEEMSFEEMVRSKLSSFLRRVEGYPVNGLYEDVIARVERPMLELVMASTGGNQVRAAEILGVNRNTLRRKLAEHGLTARMRTRRAPQKRAATKSAAAKSTAARARARSPNKVG